MNKVKLFLLNVLIVTSTACISAQELSESNFIENLIDKDFDSRELGDCNCHESALKLKQLCAKKICVKCLKAMQAHFKDLAADNFCTENVVSKSACTDNLNVNQNGCISTLTSSDIQTSDLCVTNKARINEFCGKFNAFALLSVDTNYNLGDFINFDFIEDDPNGNITLSPNFMYTAPVSGYYVVTLQVIQNSLVTTSPVLGVPMAHSQLLLNGQVVREVFTPYLTFSNQQKGIVTSVFRLNAGDTVQGAYQVLQLTDAGISPVTGTIILKGGDHNTLFAVHYLSSDCNPVDCAPRTCQPCNTMCQTPSCACEQQP